MVVNPIAFTKISAGAPALCQQPGLQFIMFDASGAKEVNTFSTPSSDFLLDLPELYEKSSLQHQDSLLGNSAQVDCVSEMPAWRETSWVHHSEDEASEVGGGLVLDGRDDLEALMGFTDEDDHFGPTPVAGVNESPYELTCKRKRSCKELEDEDEVESKLCKRQKPEEAGALHELSSPNVSNNGTGSAVTQPSQDELKSGDEFCLDQSTDELQMLCDDFGFEMPEQQCSSCSPDGGGDSISAGSARQSRRLKIKETVKMLREAIPGGECMDAAVVLDEAINYVKLLQLQVQALGAQRHAQKAGR